uniref:Putative animal heme peroxidase n=1 Tax=Corethrella appendiculata TaxID=1370023 RepID=U5ESC3_9DIPT
MKFYQIIVCLILFSVKFQRINCGKDLRCIDPKDIEMYLKYAEDMSFNQNERKNTILKFLQVKPDDTCDVGHRILFRGNSTNELEKINIDSYNMLTLLEILESQYDQDQIQNLIEGKCPDPDLSSICTKRSLLSQPSCYDVNPNYYTYDGTCNNLKNPSWGSKISRYERFLPRCYSNLVYRERSAQSGKALPDCRKIVDTLHNVTINIQPGDDEFFVNMVAFMYFETVAVDISITETTCKPACKSCTCGGAEVLSDDLLAYPSKPIKIPTDDSEYADSGVKCLTYNTLQTLHDNECRLRDVSLSNQATTYMDLSILYSFGFNENGELSESGYCSSVLPDHFSKTSIAISQSMATHSVFVNLHNYCVRESKKCDRGLSNREIAEHCRQFTIAIYQKCNYELLLPILFNFVSLQCNLYEDYDPNLPSATYAEFATGVSRKLHRYIPNEFKLMKENGDIYYVLLSDLFGNTKINCLDSIRGMIEQQIPIQNLGEQITSKFMSTNGKHGHSLPTVDCKRSRETGLCSYCDYLEVLTDYSCNSFEDLSAVMNKEVIEALKKAYESPRDIDLTVGVVMESIYNFIVSVKFLCAQFQRTQKTDRLFYTRLPENVRKNIDQFSCNRAYAMRMNSSTMSENVFLTLAKQVPINKIDKEIFCNALPSSSSYGRKKNLATEKGDKMT